MAGEKKARRKGEENRRKFDGKRIEGGRCLLAETACCRRKRRRRSGQRLKMDTPVGWTAKGIT